MKTEVRIAINSGDIAWETAKGNLLGQCKCPVFCRYEIRMCTHTPSSSYALKIWAYTVRKLQLTLKGVQIRVPFCLGRVRKGIVERDELLK